jgi:hypothetical protein
MDKSTTTTGRGSRKKSKRVLTRKKKVPSSNAPRVKIEEIGGEGYNSLAEAQAAMLKPLAAMIADIIRAGEKNQNNNMTEIAV